MCAQTIDVTIESNDVLCNREISIGTTRGSANDLHNCKLVPMANEYQERELLFDTRMQRTDFPWGRIWHLARIRCNVMSREKVQTREESSIMSYSRGIRRVSRPTNLYENPLPDSFVCSCSTRNARQRHK